MKPRFKKSSAIKFPSAFIAASLVFAGASAATAGTEISHASAKEPAALQKTEPSIYDKLWSLATLYKDKSNPWIQEISLFGRIHANWTAEETNVGDWSDWELRRARAGLRVKFLEQLDLKTEVRFLPFHDPIYDGLTEASLTWTADPAFRISIGKQLPRYTQEGAISSNELLTIERSALANTFWVGEDNYSTGVSISGEKGAWQYYLVALSGETDKAFGKLDAGWYGAASIGYDFAKPLGVDKALVRADYVYNDGDSGNTTTKPFSHTGIIGLEWKSRRYGLVSNVAYGSGLGTQPDVWGLVLIPTYALTEKLELVGRYTILDSDGPDGIRPQRRYENEVPGISGRRGDQYQAAYAGLNYYIYGHKLKLQAGIEYSHMKDSARNGGAFSAWTYSTGLRFSF